jgi:hypothetical protein
MEPTLRQLRHDLLGRANALVLCVSAIPLASDTAERLQFIDEVIRSSDNLVTALDELEASPEYPLQQA